jgi:hypothetical protein
VGRLTVGTETRDVVINNCTVSRGVVPTGQNLCYGEIYPTTIPCPGTGQDGEFHVTLSSARFTDNQNGTVADNLTGLVWLQNANCFGPLEWSQAIAAANTLADGACGLTDGSRASDWRVPNRNELTSLLDLGQVGPALPIGHLFTDFQVRSTGYWSSTTSVYHSQSKWAVDFYYGSVGYSGGNFLAVRRAAPR